MAADLTFRPPDHELITRYLCPKIADDAIEFPSIHDADVYSAAPPELAARHAPALGTDRGGDGTGAVYYFFCPVRRGGGGENGGRRSRRRQRSVGGGANGEERGCWHPEGGQKAVLDAAGRRVGNLRRLSYGVREKESRRRLTRLGWCMTEFAVDGDAADLVLCKLYRSPRAPRVEEATATASSSGSKRKSADDLTDAPVERSRPHWMKMNDHAADMVPAGADGDFHAKEEDRRIVPAPEEEALVQTRDGPRSDNDVIMALAMGATVDDLLGPQQAGEPSVSSYSSPCCPEPEPCPISSNAGGRPPFAAQAAPACGGDMSVATWAAPPAGEFSWEKELEWIQELLLGSPRVLARGQRNVSCYSPSTCWL